MPHELVTDHLLTLMILVPVIAAVALLATEAFGGVPGIAWRTVGLASAVLNALLGVLLFAAFDPTRPGYAQLDYAPWLPRLGVNYFVGIDGISLPLVLLTTLLVPVAMLASWRQVTHGPRAFVFFLLVLESAAVGAFSSLNLFQFYVYLEAMLVPIYFLVGGWGEGRRSEAALRFVLCALPGSVLMLVAMAIVAHLGFAQTGVWTFDLVHSPFARGPGLLEVEVANTGVWWQTQSWLFAAFALAFAVRIPLVPFHGWLADAEVEAPTTGSVLLAGVVLHVAAYGLLRFALPLFPMAAAAATPLVSSLAVAGIVYGCLLALAQEDLKRMVAYASLAQLGLVVLGLFAGNLQGMNGGVLHMINHGLCTAALFVLVGMLVERRGTRDLGALGGIARPMPVFAFFFALVAFASIGLPPLAGFVSELLILLGAFRTSPVHAVLASFGVVLSGLYVAWMLRRTLLGPVDNPENRKLIDLDWRETGLLLALCVPIVAIGVHPSPLLRRIEPAVSDLLQQIETRRSAVAEALPRDLEEVLP